MKTFLLVYLAGVVAALVEYTIGFLINKKEMESVLDIEVKLGDLKEILAVSVLSWLSAILLLYFLAAEWLFKNKDIVVFRWKNKKVNNEK